MATVYGLPACSCLVEWTPAFVAKLGTYGIKIRFTQLNGSYGPSAGTHKGGAFDLVVVDPGARTTSAAYDLIVKTARQMGADATWERPYNWDRRGGIRHTHGLLTGCPHLSQSARGQQSAVKNDRNGLANNGKDTGPRPLSGRTWRQGIEWAKPPKPVKMRHTDFTAAILNARSKTTGFPTRVPVINNRIRKYRPHFIGFTELQSGSRKRGLVSVALRTRWKLSFYAHNKAQYVLNSTNGWHKVRTEKYSLGNNRHAIAVHYKHKGSGAELVNVTPHLSWEHEHSARRTTEAKTLIGFLKRDFKGLPWLIAGDLNDSHKSASTRKVDSSGVVFKAAGLHDLSFDPSNENKTDRGYNTAHGNKTPIPASGIHIDRFWGTSELKGLEWINDVHKTGRRASDHWLVVMKIRLTHPVK